MVVEWVLLLYSFSWVVKQSSVCCLPVEWVGRYKGGLFFSGKLCDSNDVLVWHSWHSFLSAFLPKSLLCVAWHRQVRLKKLRLSM